MLYKFDDKSGRAICTFGFSEGPGSEVLLFQGVVDGTIVSPRGPKDPSKPVFGWNPIFEPVGFGETYAEMDGEQKNAISHRFVALMKLKEFLEKRAQA